MKREIHLQCAFEKKVDRVFKVEGMIQKEGFVLF